MWNIVEDQKSSVVANYTLQNAGAVGSTQQNVPYVKCDFAQVSVPWDRESLLVHGKPILNAIVNFQFRAPTASTSYVLHAMYIYNASLLCSRGSAEYIF